MIVGVNIGKTKVVPEDEAIDDYATSAPAARAAGRLSRRQRLLAEYPGPARPAGRRRLRPLLRAVRAAADEAAGRDVPLLVKIAPDLADQDIDAVADLAVEIGLDGIVATNTTIGRDGLSASAEEVSALGAGGLSGPVLRERALEVLRRLRARVGGDMTLIGVGGIDRPGRCRRAVWTPAPRSCRDTPASSTRGRFGLGACTVAFKSVPSESLRIKTTRKRRRADDGALASRRVRA